MMAEIRLLCLLLPVILVIVTQFETTNADCCACPIAFVCNDSTKCTPCCGYGKCNFFCCRCKCRHHRGYVSKSKQIIQAQQAKATTLKVFKSIDKDDDGKISLAEAVAAAGDRLHAYGRKDNGWFTEMDLNGDGFIQKGEFDDTLDN